MPAGSGSAPAPRGARRANAEGRSPVHMGAPRGLSSARRRSAHSSACTRPRPSCTRSPGSTSLPSTRSGFGPPHGQDIGARGTARLERNFGGRPAWLRALGESRFAGRGRRIEELDALADDLVARAGRAVFGSPLVVLQPTRDADPRAVLEGARARAGLRVKARAVSVTVACRARGRDGEDRSAACGSPSPGVGRLTYDPDERRAVNSVNEYSVGKGDRPSGRPSHHRFIPAPMQAPPRALRRRRPPRAPRRRRPPPTRFPAAFSEPDRAALKGLGPVMGALLDGSFAAAVVPPEGWVGIFLKGHQLVSIERVQAVGRTLTNLGPERHVRGPAQPLDARQADALGLAQSAVRDLHVGLVGTGGLGSPAGEVLERMGVARVTLMDADRLDTPSNARRVFGSTAADLRAASPPLKVDVVGRHLDTIGLGTVVVRRPLDVRTERACRELLDCDVVICATDTHSSRSALNDLAYACGLPVLDVGVRTGARAGALSALAAEFRVLTPPTPCLWCRGVLSADVIGEELLPPERYEQLRREGYLVGGRGGPEPSVAALTVLGAGLVTCALLALVCPDGAEAPGRLPDRGLLRRRLPARPCTGGIRLHLPLHLLARRQRAVELAAGSGLEAGQRRPASAGRSGLSKVRPGHLRRGRRRPPRSCEPLGAPLARLHRPLRCRDGPDRRPPLQARQVERQPLRLRAAPGGGQGFFHPVFAEMHREHPQLDPVPAAGDVGPFPAASSGAGEQVRAIDRLALADVPGGRVAVLDVNELRARKLDEAAVVAAKGDRASHRPTPPSRACRCAGRAGGRCAGRSGDRLPPTPVRPP